MNEHFLITGGLGFIGAWAARNLIREGAQVTIFDRDTDPHRLKLIMTPNELARIRLIEGDIVDTEAVERVVEDGITHVLHLAALQMPFCKADPVMGAKVNNPTMIYFKCYPMSRSRTLT